MDLHSFGSPGSESGSEQENWKKGILHLRLPAFEFYTYVAALLYDYIDNLLLPWKIRTRIRTEINCCIQIETNVGTGVPFKSLQKGGTRLKILRPKILCFGTKGWIIFKANGRIKEELRAVEAKRCKSYCFRTSEVQSLVTRSTKLQIFDNW